jgi:hypothetical protein
MFVHFFATTDKLREIRASEIGYHSSAHNSSIIKDILNVAYIWGGIIAVIAIIIAGFMYATSQDDPNQIRRAKNALLAACVGLAVILLAFVITNTVINGVLGT